MGTHPIFESDFDCLTEWVVDLDRVPESVVAGKKIENDRAQGRTTEIASENEIGNGPAHVIENGKDHETESAKNREIGSLVVNDHARERRKNENRAKNAKASLSSLKKSLKRKPKRKSRDFQAVWKHGEKHTP